MSDPETGLSREVVEHQEAPDDLLDLYDTEMEGKGIQSESYNPTEDGLPTPSTEKSQSGASSHTPNKRGPGALIQKRQFVAIDEEAIESLVQKREFDDVDEETIENYVAEHDQAKRSTMRKTLCDMRTLTQFLDAKNEKREIYNIPPKELNSLLCQYFYSLRKSDGKHYEPSTLRGMMCSFDRFLRHNGYSVEISKSAEFAKTRNLLKARQTELKKLGKGNAVRRRGNPKDEEIDEMFDNGQLGMSNPTTLLHTLWVFNTVYFGIQSFTQHYQMKWGDVKLCTDSNNKEFLQLIEKQTKIKTGMKNVPHRAWANENDPSRCPVEAYKLFRAKRPKQYSNPDDPYYIQENAAWHLSEHWYKAQRVGINKVGKFMRRLALNPGTGNIETKDVEEKDMEDNQNRLIEKYCDMHYKPIAVRPVRSGQDLEHTHSESDTHMELESSDETSQSQSSDSIAVTVKTEPPDEYEYPDKRCGRKNSSASCASNELENTVEALPTDIKFETDDELVPHSVEVNSLPVIDNSLRSTSENSYSPYIFNTKTVSSKDNNVHIPDAKNHYNVVGDDSQFETGNNVLIENMETGLSESIYLSNSGTSDDLPDQQPQFTELPDMTESLGKALEEINRLNTEIFRLRQKNNELELEISEERTKNISMSFELSSTKHKNCLLQAKEVKLMQENKKLRDELVSLKIENSTCTMCSRIRKKPKTLNVEMEENKETTSNQSGSGDKTSNDSSKIKTAPSMYIIQKPAASSHQSARSSLPNSTASSCSVLMETPVGLNRANDAGNQTLLYVPVVTSSITSNSGVRFVTSTSCTNGQIKKGPVPSQTPVFSGFFGQTGIQSTKGTQSVVPVVFGNQTAMCSVIGEPVQGPILSGFYPLTTCTSSFTGMFGHTGSSPSESILQLKTHSETHGSGS